MYSIYSLQKNREPVTDKPEFPAFKAVLQQPSTTAIEQFNTAQANFWQPVLRSADLAADQLVAVQLLGQPLVLARLDGELTALLDVCRHFQARLSLGEITTVNGSQAIQCPYHGWTYGQNGRCVRIPQLKANRKVPETIAVQHFAVTEAYGLIWVCLAGTPTFELPQFPEYSDQDYRLTTLDEEELTRTSSPRMIMATLDDTHFPWVHEGILGNREQPQAPDHNVIRNDCTLEVSYQILQPPSLAAGATHSPSNTAEDMVQISYANKVHMPNVIELKKTTPAGTYIIWLATSPVDYRHTRNFWTFARDYDKAPSSDAGYEAFSAHVRQQDKPIIESQRPWMLPPFWTQIEMPQAGIDAPLIAYQRWLQELGVVIEL